MLGSEPPERVSGLARSAVRVRSDAGADAATCRSDADGPVRDRTIHPEAKARSSSNTPMMASSVWRCASPRDRRNEADVIDAGRLVTELGGPFEYAGGALYEMGGGVMGGAGVAALDGGALLLVRGREEGLLEAVVGRTGLATVGGAGPIGNKPSDPALHHVESRSVQTHVSAPSVPLASPCSNSWRVNGPHGCSSRK